MSVQTKLLLAFLGIIPLALLTQNCVKANFKDKISAKSLAPASESYEAQDADSSSQAYEEEVVEPTAPAPETPVVSEPPLEAAPPLVEAPPMPAPTPASPEPAPSEPAPMVSLPPVKDKEIDPQLEEVVSLIQQVSPEIHPSGIFYVKSGLFNVGTISLLSFNYEKKYSPANTTTQCVASYNRNLIEAGGITIPLGKKEIGLDLIQCLGFVEARDRKAASGSCRAGRTQVRADVRARGIISEKLFSVDYDLVQDANCLCHQEYAFRLLEGMVYRYTAKAFVDSARCSGF